MQKWLEALKEKLTGNKKAALLLGVVALLLVLSAVVLKMGNGNPLYGNWILDEVTGYEFDRNGKGVMSVQSSEYPFTYQIDGDQLFIDFELESAADRTYTYTIDDDVLKLSAGGQHYEMKKRK